MRRIKTTTTVLRELEDGTELEIEVECSITPGEPQWFNPLEGVGHPGSGPEVEILGATLDGLPIELTDAECERIEDELDASAGELLEDAEADRADHLYDQWKDRQMGD